MLNKVFFVKPILLKARKLSFFSINNIVSDETRLNEAKTKTKIKIKVRIAFSDLLVLKINAFFSLYVFTKKSGPTSFETSFLSFDRSVFGRAEKYIFVSLPIVSLISFLYALIGQRSVSSLTSLFR